MRPAFDVSRFHLMKAKGESMQTSIRSRFSLRLCCILSAVLALSICVPGGAIQALASDGGAQATTSSTASPEPAAGQAADESQSPSAVSQEQSEQAGAADPDKSAEAASASADEGTSPDGSQANETRGSPVASTPAALRSSLLRAPSAAKQVDTSITGLQILDPGKKSATELTYSSGFYLDMKWVTKPGEIVHAGDYFDVTIPDTVNLNRSETVKGFDLTNADRVVVAYATVTPAANGGGTVRVVFNDKVDGKYNVKGSLSLYAFFNQKKVKENTTVPIQLEVNGQTSEVPSSPSVVVKPNPQIQEILGKWGSKKDDDPNVVVWRMRINQQKLNLNNLVINDSLTSGNGTVIQNDPGRPIKLQEVEYDGTGNFTKVRDVDLSGEMMKVSSDGTSFRLNLGNSGTKQYFLEYYTTKTSGDSQENHADLYADDVKLKEVNITYKEKGGGGTADGDLASKIKITKVDADDNSTVLADAVFTVTGPDGSTFELTTGPDGTATSGVLTQGTYKVREKTAPKGYERNDQEYTLTVTPNGGALQTITDKPVKTTVKVDKKWVGPEGDAVTVHLLADGEDTDKALILDKAGSWAGAFDNLRKYKPGTKTEIAYTVSEDSVDNYSSKVSGNAASGFTVTNTNTETVAIKGTKTWDDGGDRDGMRPKEIKIHLLADGAEVSSKTVAAADNWSWLFADQPKYAADGHEIAYTVTEDAVPGYATKVDGFNVTNSRTPGKTSVTVTKAWDDADDQDGIRPASVKVQLYANGTASGDPVTLDEGHRWTHTWTGLFQKEGGQDVVYTVRELDAPADYTSAVSGSAPEGFTVTNSHTPETINISVTKKWVGSEGDSATVRLYADGADTGKALTLDKAGSWAGKFTDLPKFEGGKEIAYTVKEDAVPDYSSAVSGDAAAGFTVTNTLNKGTFSVKKVVEGATFTGADNTFTVQYTCTHNSVALTDEQKAGSLTLTGNGTAVTSPSLPFGTSCTIEETKSSAQRAGYAVATDYTAGQVTVGTATPSPEVTVTNTYAPLTGGFVISKTVDGDGAALANDKEFTFAYTCTPLTGAAQVKGTVVVKGGENGTVADVPVGSCSVSERDATIDGASLNTVLTVDGSSDGVNNGTAVFNVKDGVTVKVAATNTYVLDRGSFSVAKKVVGGADSFTRDTFVFDYVCTDGTEGRLDVPGDGTAVEGPRVPTGTECTVTERAQTANRDGYTVTSELSDNGKVTISQKDAVVAVTATNTYTPVPKVPSKQLAKTGASNVAVVGVVGSLLVVVGGVLIALKRRRHDA